MPWPVVIFRQDTVASPSESLERPRLPYRSHLPHYSAQSGLPASHRHTEGHVAKAGWGGRIIAGVHHG